MLGQRLLWGGTTITTGVMTYLAFAQVEDQLARWAFGIVFALLFIASMMVFPYGQNADGSAKRVINYVVRGRNNPSVQAAEGGTITGPVMVTGRGTVNQHGLSPEQLSGLTRHPEQHVVLQVDARVAGQMEVFKGDFAKLYGDAYGQALDRAQNFLATLVETMAVKAPGNLAAIGTIEMQQAILNAQTSAALHGDDDLTGTLVDVLIDKSSAEPRSLTGVVLTEAVLVAGKLTSEQINLLTGILILSRTINHNLVSYEMVLDYLDGECRPLYNRIPKDKSTIQYLTYTGVGSQNALGSPKSMRGILLNCYDAVLTTGFPADAIPDEIKQYDIFADLPDTYESPVGNRRFLVASSQTVTPERLGPDNALLPFQDKIIQLIRKNQLPDEKFAEMVESSHPDFARFIAELDALSAPTFVLSSVGCALGQANWRRLRPESAPAVAIYLT